MRAHGNRATFHLTDFNETLPVYRVHPKTQAVKMVSFWLFLEGDRPPLPRLLGIEF